MPNGQNQDEAPKNQFVQDFLTVYNYNVENGAGDNLTSAATSTEYTLGVIQTENHSKFRVDNSGPGRSQGFVFWNPTEGLETSKGTLSPGTILEHEMDHGVDWETNTTQHIKNQGAKDEQFDNKEEKRVIMGSEYKTAVANKEFSPIPKIGLTKAVNYRSHSGGNSFVKVVSPISNKKKP